MKLSFAMKTMSAVPGSSLQLSNAAIDARLIRLPEVLKIYPLGKTSWYAGIKSGLFPRPKKLHGGRAVAWYEHEVIALAESLRDDA